MEAMALGSRLAIMREVAGDVLGAAAVARALQRVDSETRGAFEAAATAPEWVPTRYLSAWASALFEHECGGQADERYVRWVAGVTHVGFGKLGRLYTSLSSPAAVLRRADYLWHLENSSGTLTSAPLGPTSARLTLRDHPFTKTRAMRVAMTEAFRYVIVLCRVGQAIATHEAKGDGVLHVTLAWR
jgi:hypothetical protein